MASLSFAQPTYSLLYRGNSINGWLSAFLSYTALRGQGVAAAFYPLCGHRVVTEKEVKPWKGSHVLILDMDAGAGLEKNKETLLSGGALSVEVIAADPSGEISTVVEVWRRWYGAAEVPFWLASMDRIIRWADPCWEDRCLREVLLPVAHMPPQDALRATEAFMTWTMNPTGAEFQGLLTQGQDHLLEKDKALCIYLCAQGLVHEITASDAEAWGLSPEWVGMKAYLLDNTDTVLDTNEAAHLIFMNNPSVGIFVNYRKKVRKEAVGAGTMMRKLGVVYAYSARSKAFDLTTGGFFQGRAGSAGAQVPVGREVMPFVPFVSEIMNI
jgi:hypothetical protein